MYLIIMNEDAVYSIAVKSGYWVLVQMQLLIPQKIVQKQDC